MNIKKLSIDYGLCMAVIVVLFVLVFVLALFSRQAWNGGLQKQLVSVLSQSHPGEYIVSDPLPIDNPFSVSAAAYQLMPVSSAARGTRYGVIIRIPTLYGSLPGVFVYTENAGAEFVGIAGFSEDSAKEQAVAASLADSVQISRWEKRIPVILKDAVQKTPGGR
ncbi:hypothetical protein [Treponema brennaborense]|uniref:Uncharacterized protein n=1 Tax=Treponema brennaborense (strain DSM 12168 / CIP 105900 / DD5/3) TaxID=906968 RepID=F4LMQ8_TREBD|nr:hypothetical protein [Treponema brennaborense]AEE16805.1 hypothetical protein Trebr_1381 [Treponema brennaborense DSM 12168]